MLHFQFCANWIAYFLVKLALYSYQLLQYDYISLDGIGNTGFRLEP